ncbi:MAG TPA: beta-ketoacyl synthase N-terminal-like domain-containing protein, partial [Chloroflexota bacterium]|nr:beta-ketoacyl synthase N-terminal-like domain-containing protein [Chloroflexota bacterium]
MVAGAIAIIGMAGIFPQAANLAQFWDNIVRGRDCISEVPESHWRLADHYDPDPGAPDKTYSRWGGFIPPVLFDPVEFGIPPNLLEVTDTSQLLSLIVAKRALEDAGYGDGSSRPFDRERTGVVLGVGGGQKLVAPLSGRLQAPRWEEAMRSSGLSQADATAIADKVRAGYPPWEENSFPGLLGNVVAGRIANRLDLGGMNCVVDAACASSLAGLRMAMAELNDGQADMMISGGVDVDNSIFMYLCFSKTPAFTPGDRIRPFDAASDGMMVGEGIGMLILKRLADAERDADRIYAVIRGLGSSSDGRFKSVYAPRAEGQVRAVTRAYANAGVPLTSVGLIEAHGTGTAAGDLVEVTTLQKLFSDAGAEANQTAIGSIKSQVGHTKAAAGVAGIIKTALALQHKVLPPTINIEQPHPAGNFGQAPLYLNAETRPWLPNHTGEPRRAGVSSFGFGGTNYHVVLEEYEAEADQPYRLHQVPRAIVLTAPDAAELAARCDALARGLSEEDFQQLAAASEQLSIAAGEARVGFVAGDPAEAARLAARAAEQLRRHPGAAAWELPEGVSYRQRALAQAKVAALFPGQGSQYVNMGRELASNYPEVRHVFAQVDGVFGGLGLSCVVYPPSAFSDGERAAAEERLRATQHAQPAIGTLSAAMFTLLRQRKFAPDFAAGHSFGELTALWAAGALSEGDFLWLAARRGAAMVPPQSRADFDAGAMLSVRGSVEDARRILEPLGEVVLANVNSPRQVVLAGPTPSIQAAHEKLGAAGVAAQRLAVSAAFHSPLVAHAQAAFAQALAGVELTAPLLPVFANTTAEPYPNDVEAMASLLRRQMLEPVQFAATVENLYAAGARIFVEVGPRSVLTNLVRETLGPRDHVAIALDGKSKADADRAFRNALVQLAVAGVAIDLRDPYLRALPAASLKASPAAVMLTGANYVSEKSRLKQQQALHNGHTVAAVSGTAVPAVVSEEEEVAEVAGEGMKTLDQEMTALHSAAEQVAGPAISLADLHRQFLAEQAEQARTFLELLSKQQDLARLPGLASLPASLHESLAAGLSLYHQVQAATVAAHVAFLQAQGGGLAGAGQPQGASHGVAFAPRPLPPVAAAAPLTVPTVAPPPPAAVPQIAVAAPPGPAPSPPAGREAFVEVVDPRRQPQQERWAVAGRRAEVGAVASGGAAVEGHVPAAGGKGYVPEAAVAASGNGHAPVAALNPAAALLAVVSEKTGYPLETLDLGMD